MKHRKKYRAIQNAAYTIERVLQTLKTCSDV